VEISDRRYCGGRNRSGGPDPSGARPSSRGDSPKTTSRRNESGAAGILPAIDKAPKCPFDTRRPEERPEEEQNGDEWSRDITPTCPDPQEPQEWIDTDHDPDRHRAHARVPGEIVTGDEVRYEVREDEPEVSQRKLVQDLRKDGPKRSQEHTLGQRVLGASSALPPRQTPQGSGSFDDRFVFHSVARSLRCQACSSGSNGLPVETSTSALSAACWCAFAAGGMPVNSNQTSNTICRRSQKGSRCHYPRMNSSRSCRSADRRLLDTVEKTESASANHRS